MPKTKRASPALNRTDLTNGPSPQDILAALAMEVLDQEAMVTLRERRKAHRKAYELKGGTLQELDRAFKMTDQPVSEIKAWFRRNFAVLGAVFPDLVTQYDLFTVKAEPETKAAHRHVGKMAGLTGKAPECPDSLVGEPLQEWMAGWQEGHEARAGAEQTLADVLAAALDNAEKGIVTDGTGGKRLTKKELKAREVALRASSDFTEDEAERARAAGLEMAKGADFGPTDAETVFN